MMFITYWNNGFSAFMTSVTCSFCDSTLNCSCLANLPTRNQSNKVTLGTLAVILWTLLGWVPLQICCKQNINLFASEFRSFFFYLILSSLAWPLIFRNQIFWGANYLRWILFCATVKLLKMLFFCSYHLHNHNAWHAKFVILSMLGSIIFLCPLSWIQTK